jgi:glucosyl-3-phosphoglycerate synthase
MITFVILAHNEEDTISDVTSNVRAAVSSADRLLVVDSGSTDATPHRARDAGAEVLSGPLGKGAAMEAGVRATTGEFVCFLDADQTYADQNIALRLAEEIRSNTAPDHVVGDFDDGLFAILTNTDGFYNPLVQELFPEVHGHFGSKPLTGFRIVRRTFLDLPLPAHFGVEAHLNITSTMAGAAVSLVHLGRFTGKLKANKSRTLEITGTILDLAERYRRIDPDERGAWEAWVSTVYGVASGWGPDTDQEEYRAALMTAAGAPFPPRGRAHPRSGGVGGRRS